MLNDYLLWFAGFVGESIPLLVMLWVAYALGGAAAVSAVGGVMLTGSFRQTGVAGGGRQLLLGFGLAAATLLPGAVYQHNPGARIVPRGTAIAIGISAWFAVALAVEVAGFPRPLGTALACTLGMATYGLIRSGFNRPRFRRQGPVEVPDEEPEPEHPRAVQPPEPPSAAATKSALDELFYAASRYRTSDDFRQLLEFTTRFRRYSPFNCFLLHMQKPGVSYVATAPQWWHNFERRPTPGSRPLVIMCPGGPVMFVFDAAETEGKPLPPKLLDPFETKGRNPVTELRNTLANLPGDRIRYEEGDYGPDSGGWVAPAKPSDLVEITHKGKVVVAPAFARMVLNKNLDIGPRYATLVHELGHVYSGHLGTPDKLWWPDRQDLSPEAREFEAEAISYLVCMRAGVSTSSDEYLSGYLDENFKIPEISLDRVLVAAGRIEEMGRGKVAARGTGRGADAGLS